MEIGGQPRALQKNDITEGELKTRGSKRPADVVVQAWRFDAAQGPVDVKRRRFFKVPPAEKCKHDYCACANGPEKTTYTKRHSEMVYVAALRPPFTSKESRERNFKKVKRGEARDFQLAPGICQSIDGVCRADEAFVRATTRGGNLPVTAAA